jgi:phage-related protein
MNVPIDVLEVGELSRIDLKPLRYASDAAKRELKEQVPDEIKKRLGFQLKKVQLGYKPDDFKPMPSVGKAYWKSEFRMKLAAIRGGVSILPSLKRRFGCSIRL